MKWKPWDPASQDEAYLVMSRDVGVNRIGFLVHHVTGKFSD